MHDLYAARLTTAMHAHVADVEPGDRLDQVLERAHRPGLWLIALTATICLTLIAVGLLLIAHQDDKPAQPTIHFQEA